MTKLNKAVFLDRDGTINVEKNYLYKIEDFEFIEGAPEAIKLLNDNGYKVIVVTNQAGVARGYYTEDDVKKLHKYIDGELKKYGAHIDAYYYCPHHPIYGIGEYKVECNCRKPKPGLLERAIEDFGISVENSWLIGDNKTDIEAGNRLNLNTILVITGHGKSYSKYALAKHIFKNLKHAVIYILNTNKQFVKIGE